MYHTVYHAKIYVDRVGLRLFAGLTDSKRGYGMGRRMVGLHAVFLASALMLGGCGTGNKVVNFEIPNENVTTITFFGNKYEPENVTVIEEILSDFMKENPGIRVSYESLKGNEYYEALGKRFDAGKGDDVFMVNHDVLLEMQSRGQLVDLSGLKTIQDYSDRMLRQMVEHGKIYWVPTTVSGFGLYCNKKLLKEHKQKLPENLQEWRQVCSYFKEQGITPVIANNDISLKTLAIGRSFYSAYQENREDERFRHLNEGKEQLSFCMTPGFSLVKEFIDNGYVDAGKALETRKTSDDLEEFVKGESPFMLTGAWAAGRVEGMDPDFDFVVAPYPVLEDGGLVVINADTRLSVNRASEHIDEALAFVEFFTRSENIQKFADQQSSFSPLRDGIPSSVKEIQPIVSCYQSGRTVIGTDALLELPIWELTAGASERLMKGEELEDTMKWMDQEAAGRRGGW